jgi:hypothetical protein
MTQKKAPADNEGSKPKFEGQRKLPLPALKHKQILLYKEGFEISNPSNFQAGSHQRSKRGSVTSWSRASRRRMRRFMIENSVPEGWLTFGVTYTIPGDPVTDEQSTALWKNWSRRAEKNGWAVVWRVEIQQRKQRHWHCIVGVPAAAPAAPICARRSGKGLGALCAERDRNNELTVSDTLSSAEWQASGERLREEKRQAEGFETEAQPPRNGAPAAAPSASFIASVKRAFFDEWSAVVDTLGSCTQVYADKSGPTTVTVNSRMFLRGAYEHAVNVQTDGDRGSWKRYLQDHATKSKQEQLVGSGRHWGVVGRKHFARIAPTDTLRLSDEIFYRVVRALQRLSTRSIPAKCVFGRKLGFRNRRGSYGVSVWFSKPETVRRLVQFYCSSTSRLASHPKPLSA